MKSNCYFVEIKHGTLSFFSALRGISQSDVEQYCRENMQDFESYRISNAPIELVSHEEGWQPTEKQKYGRLIGGNL